MITGSWSSIEYIPVFKKIIIHYTYNYIIFLKKMYVNINNTLPGNYTDCYNSN